MKRFKNILYVISSDDNNPQALARAVSRAKLNQANLTLLKVIPELSSSSYSEIIGLNKNNIEDTVLARSQETLSALVESIDLPTKVTGLVKMGKVYQEIIDTVQANQIDLVIKEAQTSTWLERFFGSSDLNLLRFCPAPVWLMKADQRVDYKNILVAVSFDGSDEVYSGLNKTLLKLASSLALIESASLHIVNVYDAPDAGFIGLWAEDPESIEKQLFSAEQNKSSHKIESLVSELRQELGAQTYQYLAVNTYLKQGEPAEQLVKLANQIEADLVVLGTVSKSGIAAAVLGNTAETVLSQLDCAVLAVKPDGFISI